MDKTSYIPRATAAVHETRRTVVSLCTTLYWRLGTNEHPEHLEKDFLIDRKVQNQATNFPPARGSYSHS